MCSGVVFVPFLGRSTLAFRVLVNARTKVRTFATSPFLQALHKASGSLSGRMFAGTLLVAACACTSFMVPGIPSVVSGTAGFAC
jgi:hypothetical protein